MNPLRAMAIVLIFACNVTHAASSALPVADHVPANAMVYLGWAGTDTLSPAYANSPLKAFIDGSNLPTVADDLLPKVWSRITADPDNKALSDTLRHLLPILAQHPSALYLSDIKLSQDGNPMIDCGLLCDAGGDAEQLLGDFNALAADFPDLKLKANRAGSLVRLGNEAALMTASLAKNAAFVAAMKPLQASPAIAVFIDGDKILRHANEAATEDDSTREAWPKIRDALGIGNFKSYAMTAGFDDSGNWASASALIAPGPRDGLLAAIEPKPIDPALLARIPGSAQSVAVYNLDAAKLFDSIGDAMAVSKPSDTAFHQAAGVASLALGRNFRRAILGPLGPQWVIYTDANSHQTTAMNHPVDADTASDSMVSAAFGLINTANAQIPDANVTAVQQKTDGIDLTSAKSEQASPFVGTPTFAVQNGIFYFASAPATVVAAANLKPIGEASDFFHDPDFAAALYRLHVPTAGSIDYCNLSRTAPHALPSLQSEASTLQVLLDIAHIDLPKIELPTLKALEPHLSPAMSVSWADTDGVYTRSLSPFPGSAPLLGDPQESVISLGTVSLAAGIMLPAIDKARQQARLTLTMSREKQIVLGMVLWSVDHHGALPPDLGSLMNQNYIKDPRIFLTASGAKVPAEIATADPARQADWVNTHAEFTYLGAGKKFSDIHGPSQFVVLVPKARVNTQAPVPLGFADGHVEAVAPPMVKKYLDAAQ